MTYAWTLFNEQGELQAIFTEPGLAFRTLERTYGVGFVRAIHRGSGVWKIEVKSKGLFLCTLWTLRSQTMELGTRV